MPADGAQEPRDHSFLPFGFQLSATAVFYYNTLYLFLTTLFRNTQHFIYLTYHHHHQSIHLPSSPKWTLLTCLLTYLALTPSSIQLSCTTYLSIHSLRLSRRKCVSHARHQTLPQHQRPLPHPRTFRSLSSCYPETVRHSSPDGKVHQI